MKDRKKCFVIMPFKSPYKGEKGRYGRIFKPAIKAAGLSPHLAGGPGVNTITKDIEDGIRNSHLCLAEISEDNPNVWYELGFAYACGKQVVMVCDRKKRPEKLPFDVSVKNVNFHPDVQSAANRKKFKRDITEDLKKKATATLAAVKPSVVNLSPARPIVINQVASSTRARKSAVSVRNTARHSFGGVWSEVDKKVFKKIVSTWVKRRRPARKQQGDYESGLLDLSSNPMAVMNSLDHLTGKGFITQRQGQNWNGRQYAGYALTPAGEKFAKENPHLFD